MEFFDVHVISTFIINSYLNHTNVHVQDRLVKNGKMFCVLNLFIKLYF